MYRIGEFSIITKLSIQTLRYYEKLELLIPSHKDFSSGYRYYNDEQIYEAIKIKQLKELQFSLQEIKELLDDNNVIDFGTLLEQKQKEITEELERLEIIKSQVENTYHKG